MASMKAASSDEPSMLKRMKSVTSMAVGFSQGDLTARFEAMADPEARAAETLAEIPRWLWDGKSLPVPVEDIVDSHFELHVCETPDLSCIPGAPVLAEGEDLSGLLIVDLKQIWVIAREPAPSPARRRFTIGHEL